MNADEKGELIQIVGATAELMETHLSDAAAQMLVNDLAAYPYDQVVKALERCRQEVTGRLTASAVISRLDDDRPGPETAWARMPASEEQSVVWTDEMAKAYGESNHLKDRDPIAARMAFKEAYERFVLEARRNGVLPRWRLSPGRDPEGRKDAVRQAVDQGYITHETALKLLPHYQEEPSHALRLGTDKPTRVQDTTKYFEEMRKAMK